MKNLHEKIYPFVLIAIVGAAIFFGIRSEGIPPATPGMKTYENPAYDISFSYPASYVLEEYDTAGSAMRIHHAIVLTPAKDLPAPENSEGPPSITIDIYQNNLDHLDTETWIRNSSASNFKLGEGRLATTSVSGLPALSYRWSGLYEGTTIAVAEQKWVYAFTVTYLDMGADIIQDFVALRESAHIGATP